MNKKFSRKLKEQSGFSMVEAMVALVISVVVAFGFYALYNHQHKQYIAERVTSEAQSNARFIIESLGRDLIMTGYRPVNQPGISLANSSSITIEYWDEKADSDSTYDKHRQVTFQVDTTDADRPLLRKVQKYNSSLSTYSAATDQIVGEQVQSLSFEYFDNENNDLGTPGTTLSELEKIRNIKVTVNVRSVTPDPFTGEYKELTLSGTYRARNLGIVDNPVDTEEPDPPETVEAVDPGICGELDIRWTASGAADLAGYYIYYGQESGSYVERIKVGDPTATSYTLTDLSSTNSDAASPVTYYIAMTAYDNSANNSGFSEPEVAGSPNPSVRTFAGTMGGTENDTTINPEIPLAPADFDADDGTVDGQVILTWTPSISEDVVGYRLHRSRTPEFTPDNSNEIADELILTSDMTSHTDTGLLGCVTYYYKIASINCDTSLVPQYSEQEYSYCYGDGELSGIPADLPNAGVTDSTPIDNIPIDGDPYPVPALSSIPGWRRVFISLTNPNKTDDPDFNYTKIYWSTSGFPTIDGNCVVSSGELVPDDGGYFDDPGSGTSFIHDSETVQNPVEPSLQNLITYYYLAVSYDLCGNCTSATEEATTLSELCGDDPAGLPEFGNGSMIVDSDGCYGYIHLWWTEGGLKDVYDFAGYHVYRNEGPYYDENDPTHVELTGGIPQWFNYYTDDSIEEGKVYSYAVKYTDCAWEHDNGGNISPPQVIENQAAGQLFRESGDDFILSADPYIMPPTYEHNIVTFLFHNSSGGTMTISNLDVRWQNDLAYLHQVIIGDNNTTSEEVVWEDNSLPLSYSYTGGPLTMAKSIDPNDYDIPISFVFALSDGTVDYNCDMRENFIEVEVKYTNNTTGSDYCYGSDTLYVPLGPVVTRTSQNKPSLATPAWAVPGAGGTSAKDQVIVPGGVDVTVNTYIYDTFGVGISNVTLYYHVDSGSYLEEAPAYDGYNYTPLPMTFVSGNLWKLDSGYEIPANDDCSIWYFIVAEDGDGNFDREPEPRAGAFQYYQQPGDICNNESEAPVLTNGYVDGSFNVFIEWLRPDYNTDGSPANDLVGYRIYRSDGYGFWLYEDIPDPSVTSYTDYNAYDVYLYDYSYYVTAYDRCTPDPVESGASNVYTECEGAPMCILTTQPSYSIMVGDSFTINLTVCDRINGISGEILYVQTCSSPYNPDNTSDADSIRMKEDGDTGTFYIDQTYYGGRSSVQTYPYDDYPQLTAIDLDLWVYTWDDVIVGGYRDYAYSGDSCQNPYECSEAGFWVEADPCVDPQTPEPPEGLYGIVLGNKDVELYWNSPYGMVTGYRVYRQDDGGLYNLIAELDSSTFNHTDTPGGNLNQHVYSYQVTAVNASCPTEPKESVAAQYTENK